MNLSPVSPGHSLLVRLGTGDHPLHLEAANVLNTSRGSPESPPFEPLTPTASSDGYASHMEGAPRRFGSVARTLARRLRTPIDIDNILNSILRVTDASEAHELDEYLRQTLNQFSKPQQSRIESFAQKISRIYAEGHQDEHSDDAEAFTVCMTDKPPFLAESGRSIARRRAGVFRDVSSSTMDDKERERVGLQAANSDTGNSDESVTTKPLTERPGTSIVVSGPKSSPSGSEPDTTPDVTNQQEVAFRDPAGTAGSFREIVSPKARRKARHVLLDQSVTDFIYESYGQIRRLSLPGNSRDTYKALFDALQAQNEQENTWSDGSQWMALVEVGDNDRCMGSIRFALAACGFARWHQSQVRWLERVAGMDTQTAINAVFERVLGSKPQQPEAIQGEWQRRRQKLSTYCTRGKKWLRLLDAFDLGILFKHAWDLVKSRDAELDTLIQEGTHQLQKMGILQLLKEQMTCLLNVGRTDPEEFRKKLIEKGYLDPCATPFPTGNNEVDAFFEEVRGSGTSDRFLIPWAEFRFDIASLQRLGSTKWLDDDIVLACLHLSAKLPFIRVGFSIPIHRQTATRAGHLLPRPFERAASRILEEHDSQQDGDSSGTRALVWLFPLFQHQGHFSLLEVNERTGKIYHYDSMNHGENSDIKAACEKEFTRFQYTEEQVMQQHDTYSCGPLVIKNARDRMLGRPVVSGTTPTYDPTKLRMEALHILRSAWSDGALIVAPMDNMDMKRKSSRMGVSKARKRQRVKTRQFGEEGVIEID